MSDMIYIYVCMYIYIYNVPYEVLFSVFQICLKLFVFPENIKEKVITNIDINIWPYSFSQSSCPVVPNSLRSHGLQHTRLPRPSQLQERAQTHVRRVSDAT